MIGIIDYGMGNLRSVKNALDKLNIESIISNNINELEKCKRLILPGVGSFNQAMKNIKEKELDKFIKRQVESNKPLLGICLGMQLLFEEGFEGEKMKGLGLLKGKVVKIDEEGRRIPHIGWNSGENYGNSTLLKGIENQSYFYYVHSYIAADYNKEDLIIKANYKGVSIPGLFKRKNIVGAQFHPEKSGEIGLMLLKNFNEGE